MAISKLKITFPQNLIVGSTVSFNFKQVSTGIETPVTFTWVASRVNPYEVQLIAPIPTLIGRSSAIAFMNAFEIDEPTYDIEIQTISGATRYSSYVIITSEDNDVTFSGGVSTYREGQSSLVTFEITRETGNTPITVSGLESDNYLINNEIWMGISVVDTITRYSVTLSNVNNGKFTRPFDLFTLDNKASINLQPIIKSLFDYPNVRNQNKFQITINAYIGTELSGTNSFIKNFIRGGNRTELTNQNIELGTILRPSIKLPVWDGFPTDEYFLAEDGTIQIRPFADVNPSSKDFKRVKGCNNIYFRFLNQQGGYSNWLFESYSNPETNTNLGAYVRNNNIEDLGNEVDNSLNLFSKVPSEYYQLIKDLFVSLEIYVWQDLRWVRVLSGKNTSDYDTAKRAYSVKAKFDYENRFSPSLLWSK